MSNFLSATNMALLLAQKAPIMLDAVGNAWKPSSPHHFSQRWARWAWVWLHHSPQRFWYGRWSPSCARRSPFFQLLRLGPNYSIPQEASSLSEVRSVALEAIDTLTDCII